MEIPIIREVVIIFTLSITVLLFCHRLRLPPIVGFLLTGVLCGPHGLGLVKNVEDVDNLATVGIVLLLFTVGMEFSLGSIIKYRYYFFVGGALQVFLSFGIAVLFGKAFLIANWPVLVFLGFLVPLSSTAIVLRAIEEKGEGDSPHGKFIIGVLIFQDIIAIPMMLMVPMIAGGGNFGAEHLFLFIKGMVLLIVMAFVAWWAVPKLLDYVTRTKSKELFLLSVLTICFAVAWITSSVGLSLSLGAFLAGLVVSESEYSEEAVGNILPFQTIFTSFFFVSMGMLLDLQFVIKQPFLIVALAAAVILLKGTVAGGTALVLGLPLRSAILSGIALSQIGEFSFVIAQAGINLGLASEYQYQLFLAVSLLTMGVTPTLISWSQVVAQKAMELPLPKRIKAGLHYSFEESQQHHLKDHIIIVGFGLRGRHLAQVAKQTGIPYLILEMNPDTVKAEKLKGEPIRFGDPTHHSVLSHAGVKNAKGICIVINDPMATMRIVHTARNFNPDIYIITRCRYFKEAKPLFTFGADDVIPDEFGSSLEIFSCVLNRLGVEKEKIAKCLHEIRVEGYDAMRWQSHEVVSTPQLPFSSTDAQIETLTITDGSLLAGKTLQEAELRKNYGITVLLIKRDGQTITHLEANTQLIIGDQLVIVAPPSTIQNVKPLFQPA